MDSKKEGKLKKEKRKKKLCGCDCVYEVVQKGEYRQVGWSAEMDRKMDKRIKRKGETDRDSEEWKFPL